MAAMDHANMARQRQERVAQRNEQKERQNQEVVHFDGQVMDDDMEGEANYPALEDWRRAEDERRAEMRSARQGGLAGA